MIARCYGNICCMIVLKHLKDNIVMITCMILGWKISSIIINVFADKLGVYLSFNLIE